MTKYQIVEDIKRVEVYSGEKLILKIERKYSFWGNVYSKVFNHGDLLMEYVKSGSIVSKKIKILKNSINNFKLLRSDGCTSIVLNDNIFSIRKNPLSTKFVVLYHNNHEVGCVTGSILEFGPPYNYVLSLNNSNEFEIYLILVFVINMSTFFDHA